MKRKMIGTKCFCCLLFLSSLYGCSSAYLMRLPILLGETDRTITWSVYSTGIGTPTNKKELKERSEYIVSKTCVHGGRVITAAVPPQQDYYLDWSVIVECDKSANSQKSDDKDYWEKP